MALLLLVPAAIAARPPCGTPLFARNLAGGPPHPPPAEHFDGEKDERHFDDEPPNDVEGTNFIVRWGDDGNVSEDDAERLLSAFEDAWAAEIVSMDNPAPAGTDAWLFDVFIGDTGDGAPDGYGAAGYYRRDADGYPTVVVSAATLADADLTRSTAAHEFFHAVQDSTGRFPYDGDSAWYWEATAMWMEGQVLPEDPDYYSFLFGYALLPQLPVSFFDYPDTGAVEEYHQYGAMILPRYVSEVAGDWEIVRDSWTVDLGAHDPQEALAKLLAERGVDFADAFGDFAARNATWDYADGKGYARWVDWYADYYPADDHRVVDDVVGTTDALVAAPAETLPGRYAYNILSLRPDVDTIVVRFEGAGKGSAGHDADWRVTLVIDGDNPTYQPIPLKGGAGEVTLSGMAGARAWLAVASVPERADADETFAWSYAVYTPGEELPPADTGSPSPDQSPRTSLTATTGGCATGGAAPSVLGALAGLVVVRRRRAAGRAGLRSRKILV